MPAQAQERLYRLVVDATQANRQLRKITKSTQSIEQGFSKMRRAASQAVAAFAAFRAIGELVKASDKINLLEGSFEALTGSALRASDMLQRVYDTVTTTGASLNDVATTYQRLTVGLEELGSSNEEIQTVADTFIKLGRVSGTSMNDTNAALVQFSQGLASGKLQGDELRSIMERLPLITKLIQTEWNRVNEGVSITRGEVKQLGREGLLTAKLISDALLNGAEEVARQFAGLTFTLEQELNILIASAIKGMAELAEVTGIDVAVKESIRSLSLGIQVLTKDVSNFIKGMKALEEATGVFSIAILAAGAAVAAFTPLVSGAITAVLAFGVALNAAIILNPVGLAIALIIAAFAALAYAIGENLVFFTLDVPRAFYKMKAGILDALGFEEAAKRAFKESERYAKDLKIALDALAEGKDWEKVLELSRDLENLEGVLDELAVTAKKIETPKWDKWVKELKKYGDGITEVMDPTVAFNRAMAKLDTGFRAGVIGMKEYWFELDRLEKILSDSKIKKGMEGLALIDLSEIPNRTKVVDDYSESLDGIADSMKNLFDPLREANAELFLMDEALRLEKVTFQEWKKATDELKASMEFDQAATDLDVLTNELINSLDVTTDLEKQFRALDIAVEEGLDPALVEAFKNKMLDANEATKKTTNLMADLSQAGNHFVEGFATGFADALVDGSKSFSDFATSILEDLASMIIRAVIFNAIISGLSGTSFGNFLGVGTASSGGGINTSGAGILATGEEGGAVGVIRPPTYGFGTLAGSSSGGYGNITVNNYAQADVQIEQNKTNGMVNLDILIENKVNKSIAQGGLDKVMRSSYGLGRRAY